MRTIPTCPASLNLFEDKPIRTTALAVERRQGQLVLIQTTPRGAAAVGRVTEQRQARYFAVPRLRHGDTIRADEIQGVREFSSQTEVMQLQSEVARRLAGPTGSLRPICYGIKRSMARAAQGAFTTGTRVMAICGDTFWDELTTHPDVERPS